MTLQELDNLIYTSLKNKWGKKVERRDYRKLEKENPNFYKDKSKTAGLMFLVDPTYDLYIDINIFEDYVTMKFRKNDDTLIKIDSRYHKNGFNDSDKLLDYFLKLIDEYLCLDKRLKLFNSGTIPQDLIRESKIDSILN